MSSFSNDIITNHLVDHFLHSPDFILKVADVVSLRRDIAQQVADVYNRINGKTIGDTLCDQITNEVLRKIAAIADGVAKQARITLLNESSPNGQIKWELYKGKSSVLSQRAYNCIARLGNAKSHPQAELAKYWARDEQGNCNPTLAQVAQLSPKDILSIPGAGFGTLNEIRKLLFSKGLALLGDDKRIVYKNEAV